MNLESSNGNSYNNADSFAMSFDKAWETCTSQAEMQAVSTEAKLNLHATVLEGINAHHKAEATFKALARALKVAVSLDPARAGQIPSTKGSISE